MTISLTCTCGVHLEVDETFAGQTINCPDCQRSLVAPKPEPPGMKTSGFALASLTVALVGAFTILGTLVAILLGWLGLRAIRAAPDKLTGRNYAVAGIVLGGVLTLFTLYAVIRGELFGLGNLFNRAQWAGQLEYDGPDEVERRLPGGIRHFVITRPSRKWGVARNSSNQGDQLAPGHLSVELWFVNTEEDAQLVVLPLVVGRELRPEDYRRQFFEEFQKEDKFGFFGKKGANRPKGQTTLLWTKGADDAPGTLYGVDMGIDKNMGSRERRFLVRVLKERDDPDGFAFVIIGGARKSRFAHVEEELTRAIKSFRLP